MPTYNWTDNFKQCYDKAVNHYRQGNRAVASYFNSDETGFLASIGCTPQELYDFAEDANNYGEPSFADALLIASARRDYFLVVQAGKATGHTIAVEDLPAKDAAVAGFAWLPRIVQKAHAKLRGEMPPDLMYGCGGDRRFLKSVNIHPADFLRMVWWAQDDNEKIVAYVKNQAATLDKA